LAIFTPLAKKIKKTLFIDRQVDPEIVRINLQRCKFMLYIIIPVHILHIVIFWAALSGEGSSPDSAITRWRIAIITIHALMILLTMVFGFLLYHINVKQKENEAIGKILPLLIAFIYLIFGAAVCVADQLVTSSITPYIIASLAVALALIMHPYYTILFYSLVFMLFYFALPLTQHNGELITSIIVNSFSASAVGLGLALITWRTNSVNLAQKRLIEEQTEELEKKNILLKKMARTDMLTGLYNRMRFTEFVEQEIARARRTGEESCLVMLDLDHFKSVNDIFGHPNGDTILKWIAGVMKSQLRDTDILARFGGEEFTILLPGTSVEGAYNVAEKVRLAIEHCTFPGQMEKLKLTASFGITSLTADANATFDSVYREADKALYRAKDKGRNRIECA
jgi:diguanylate cyclase